MIKIYVYEPNPTTCWFGCALDLFLGLGGNAQIEALFGAGLPPISLGPLTHALQYSLLMHGIARGAAGMDVNSVILNRVAIFSYLLEALYFLNCVRRGYASKTNMLMNGVVGQAKLFIVRNLKHWADPQSFLTDSKTAAHIGCVTITSTRKTNQNNGEFFHQIPT